MSTKVDSISGKCKVNISVDCPCKLSVQGQEIDAVPGDLITLEQQNLSSSAAFFIGIKEISSVLERVKSLRGEFDGFAEHEPESCSPEFVRGYCVARNYYCLKFIAKLDEVLRFYSL